MTAATGLAGYFNHVSPQQPSQAPPWSSHRDIWALQRVLDPPQGFLSVGYASKTSERRHSGGTPFESKIHFSWLTLLRALFRRQGPSLCSRQLKTPPFCGSSSFHPPGSAQSFGLQPELVTKPGLKLPAKDTWGCFAYRSNVLREKKYIKCCAHFNF